MTQTQPQQLTQCLRQLGTLQERHCRLLEAQGRALLACDRERFTALQSEYAGLLVEMERQETARRTLMQDEQGQPCTLGALLERCPERSRKALAAAGERLGRSSEKARELNRRNQTLIQNELRYFAFMLDLFVEAGRSAEAQFGRGGLGRRLLLDRRA